MFGKQLDCHVMDKAHKDVFKNGNRKWKFVPTQVKFRNEKNRERTEEEKAARVKGLLEKEKEKRTRLKELGIDYEFAGYVSTLLIHSSLVRAALLRLSRRHCLNRPK